MNSENILKQIIDSFNEAKLEAIIIGNAGAAINGAPVTTMDFDFYIRDVEKNIKKLRMIAKILGAKFVPPKSDLSKVYHIENEEEGIFLDFTDGPIGMKSFASVRSRSFELNLDNKTIHIASLKDIIESKKKANRPKDLLAIPILEATLNEKEKRAKRKA